jgi:hypothetical protein
MGMMNPKVFGMILVTASGKVVAELSSQNTIAQNNDDMMSNAIAEEIQVEETALSENATMTNQTTDGNMTGTNSTS